MFDIFMLFFFVETATKLETSIELFLLFFWRRIYTDKRRAKEEEEEELLNSLTSHITLGWEIHKRRSTTYFTFFSSSLSQVKSTKHDMMREWEEDEMII